MKRNLRMRQMVAIVSSGICLLLAGCIIVPVPLRESKKREKWREGDRSIEEIEATWYLPVAVSPEGAARLPSTKSQYRYFLKTADGHETEIACLAMESGSASGWLKIQRLKNTDFMVAMRASSHLDGEESNLVGDVTFEVIVFRDVELKHRRILNAYATPGSRTNSAWDCLQEADDGLTLYYESASGQMKYDILRDREAAVPPEGGQRQ